MFSLSLTPWHDFRDAVKSIFSPGTQIEPIPRKMENKPLSKEEIAILEEERQINRDA